MTPVPDRVGSRQVMTGAEEGRVLGQTIRGRFSRSHIRRRSRNTQFFPHHLLDALGMDSTRTMRGPGSFARRRGSGVVGGDAGVGGCSLSVPLVAVSTSVHLTRSILPPGSPYRSCANLSFPTSAIPECPRERTRRFTRQRFWNTSPRKPSSSSSISPPASEKPTKSHEAIVSDRRDQKYIKMCAIHENALMRSAIDHDILRIDFSDVEQHCESRRAIIQEVAAAASPSVPVPRTFRGPDTAFGSQLYLLSEVLRG